MVRYPLILALCLSTWPSLGQTPEWGVVISPAYSQARMARGFGVAYPGPPFFEGDLIVEERTVPGFSAEIFREKPIRIKRVSVKSAIGFLMCGALQHFEYDYANSIGNIVSIENKFRYITFNGLAKYSIPIIKRVNVIVSLGPHLGYLTYSSETSTSYLNGKYVQRNVSLLPYEKKFNYGSQLTVGARYKRISAELFYRSYYRFHYNLKEGRRVFNYGLALSYYFQKKKVTDLN